MSTQPLQRRPAAVTAVAVINFIFGGLGLLGAVCGGVGLLIFAALADQAAPPGGINPFKEMVDLANSIPGYVPFLIVSMALGLLANVLLIVTGFGLLKLRNWARMLCLGYAVYVLLSVAVGLTYQYAVVQPAMDKWSADFNQRMQKQQGKAGGPPPQNPGGQIGGLIGGIAGSIFQIAYAVGLLVVLNLRDVRRAFREGLAPVAPPESDDWRRPPGRLPDEEGPGRLRSGGDERILPGEPGA
jgi:hypothetical protein